MKKCIYLDDKCMPRCNKYNGDKLSCETAVKKNYDINNLENSQYCEYDDNTNKCYPVCINYNTEELCNSDEHCEFDNDSQNCKDKRTT